MPNCVEFYTQAILRLYRDMAATCAVSASSQASDIETLTKRSQSEGLNFLTKVLPSLGKSLDKAISKDLPFVTPSSFAKCNNYPWPRLFSGFWGSIFDRDGLVREILPLATVHDVSYDTGGVCRDWQHATHDYENRREMRVRAVRAIRQICYFAYKLEGSYAKEDEERTLSQFVETDASLPERGADLCLSANTQSALESASVLLHWVLRDLDLRKIRPGHGPGAVATGELPWEKFNFSRYYSSLDEVYPYSDYFFFNYSHLVDELENLDGLTPTDEKIAKICLVPKDSRGPRIISMEPLELQWIQQGQFRAIVHYVERHEATAGYVNFTNQEINRGLAIEHSSGAFTSNPKVTVDMQEASDRVSCWLVDKLFPEYMRQCLYASRSEKTTLPSGTQVSLRKFAPMGSAVCFPIEALTFWALAVGSLTHVSNLWDNESRREVYVYGDDMILNREDYATIKPVFEELHLKFNEDKCCTGRFFRESCGADAFNGELVTPLRVKARFDTLKPKGKSPAAALAWIDYTNQAYAKGLNSLGDYLQGQLRAILGQVPLTNVPDVHPYAFVNVNTPTEVVERYLRNTFTVRYSRAYQCEQIKLPTTSPVIYSTGAEDEWRGLWQGMNKLGPFLDPFGLVPPKLASGEHAVPRRLKPGWAWVDIKGLLRSEED